MRLDRYHGRWEFYVESEQLARTITGILAVLVIVGMARWAAEAADRVDVPSVVRPDWFRWTQLVLAVAGLASALVVTVSLLYYTATGLVWRRWRGVTITFMVLATTWSVLWLIDRWVLDAVFLG